MAYLTIISENPPRKVALHAFDTSIGRSSECEVRITNDQGVSRIHCSIQKATKDSFLILDQNTKNGTHINGKKIPNSEIELVDKDTIKIGNKTVIIFNASELSRIDEIMGQVEQEMQSNRGFHTIISSIKSESKPNK